VVIAVIGLLMAALLPALGRARRVARAVVCQANLRQWGTTLGLYTNDSGGRLPSDFSGQSGMWLFRGVFLQGDDPNANPGALHGFGTRDIICCPAAARPAQRGRMHGSSTIFESARGGEFLGTWGTRFGAWEITTPAPAFHGSYGYNRWVFSGFAFPPRMRMGKLVGMHVNSRRDGAEIPVLLDAVLPYVHVTMGVPPPWTEDGSVEIGICCMNRHDGYIGGLFLDWSARKVGLKELWALKWSYDFDRAGPWTKAGGVRPEDWPQWMRSLKDY
ncbi:MAG: hypothetical protein JW741_12920, partial [Sedimentisphaerales bacterium]|nr:hypothetical protein [Sedimentisphaerales bacterium]